jgi:CheY-like chemotaxis protein
VAQLKRFDSAAAARLLGFETKYFLRLMDLNLPDMNGADVARAIKTNTRFACNTVHGMGEDIERGGEKTQDAADGVKRRL